MSMTGVYKLELLCSVIGIRHDRPMSSKHRAVGCIMTAEIIPFALLLHESIDPSDLERSVGD